MKGKFYVNCYLFILLMTLPVFLVPSTTARLTTRNTFDGTMNILNHPCSIPPYTINKLGRDFKISSCTPNFATVASNKQGILKAEDDDGDSYYYRGLADNWVDFGGFYWRIIRINGDGTLRLIYSGTKEDHSNEAAHIGTSLYSSVADNESLAAYNLSDIKKVVDTWYENNMAGKPFTSKLADSGFCNDITKLTEANFSVYGRLYTNKSPSLKCPDKDNNLLKVSTGKLKYPIGLLNFDEASFAGGVIGSSSSFYLNIEKSYWTMTPYTALRSRRPRLSMAGVSFSGTLRNNVAINNTFVVRPVINLKSDITITSGDGTESNPYIIK